MGGICRLTLDHFELPMNRILSGILTEMVGDIVREEQEEEHLYFAEDDETNTEKEEMEGMQSLFSDYSINVELPDPRLFPKDGVRPSTTGCFASSSSPNHPNPPPPPLPSTALGGQRVVEDTGMCSEPSFSLGAFLRSVGIFMSNRAMTLFSPNEVYAAATPHPFPTVATGPLPYEPLISYIPSMITLQGVSCLGFEPRGSLHLVYQEIPAPVSESASVTKDDLETTHKGCLKWNRSPIADPSGCGNIGTPRNINGTGTGDTSGCSVPGTSAMSGNGRVVVGTCNGTNRGVGSGRGGGLGVSGSNGLFGDPLSSGDLVSELVLDLRYLPPHLRAPMLCFLVATLPHFLALLRAEFREFVYTSTNPATRKALVNVLRQSTRKVLITGVIEGVSSCSVMNSMLVLRVVRPDLAVECLFPTDIPGMLFRSSSSTSLENNAGNMEAGSFEDALIASLPLPCVGELVTFLGDGADGCYNSGGGRERIGEHPFDKICEFGFVNYKTVVTDIIETLRLSTLLFVTDFHRQLENIVAPLNPFPIQTTSGSVQVPVPSIVFARLIMKNIANQRLLRAQLQAVHEVLGPRIGRRRSFNASLISIFKAAEFFFSTGATHVFFYTGFIQRKSQTKFRPILYVSNSVQDIEEGSIREMAEVETHGGYYIQGDGVDRTLSFSFDSNKPEPDELPPSRGMVTFFGSPCDLRMLSPVQKALPVSVRFVLGSDDITAERIRKRFYAPEFGGVAIYTLRRHAWILKQLCGLPTYIDADSFGFMAGKSCSLAYKAMDESCRGSVKIAREIGDMIGLVQGRRAFSRVSGIVFHGCVLTQTVPKSIVASLYSSYPIWMRPVPNEGLEVHILCAKSLWAKYSSLRDALKKSFAYLMRKE